MTRTASRQAANGPQLTVVVIVYNDATRLPAAVSSALGQTLADLEVVIVDDASSDDTANVAARLAAGDARVRVERLAENSGGCSRPRNRGIELARGRYVMFLDSDDVLPPTAAEILVTAAEEAGADFSAGLCHRVHLSKGGRVTPWYRWLYSQRTTYTSVLENPDLLYDTLSTNKCYRKDFLDRHALRFPDGFHYEDLLFSGEVYLNASRFVLVPDVVYRWMVVESVDTPSISNRRSELRNFEDRVLIHRMLDERFAAAGAHELRLHKDVKFLRHDLVLYLPDLPFRDPDYRARFEQVARDYLRTFDERAFQRVHPVQAIAAWSLLHDDEPGLFTAVDFTAHGGKLSTRLVRSGDRVIWTEQALGTPDESLFDVTELGFQDASLGQIDLYNELVELSAGPSGLQLAGRVLNQLDSIGPDASLGGALVLSARRGSRRRTVPLAQIARDPGTGDVLWRADVDTDKVLRALGLVDRVWDLRLRLTVDGQVNESRLTARDAEWDGLALPGRPALGRLAADRLQTLVTPQADLALEWVPGTRVARSVHRAGQRVIASPTTRRGRDLARRARTVVRDPRHPRLREEVLSRVLRGVRPAARTVVFVSDESGFSPDLHAVHAEMLRRGVPVDPVVAVRPGADVGLPQGVRCVRHGSMSYFATLARAAAWVADGVPPRGTVKSAWTTCVQVPPGTPIRWEGFDDPRMKRASNDDRLALRRAVDRWDAICVRAPYDEEIRAAAYRHHAVGLRVGLPRNDVLVTAGDAEVLAARSRLGVAADADVVAFALACSRRSLDPDASMLGPGQVAVGGEGDPVDALLACDVLVTDHHPAMFDVVLRDTPVVVVGCRCGMRGSRGSGAETYVPIDDVAPGPVVWDDSALRRELGDLSALRTRTSDARAAARRRFAEWDKGAAAAGVVDFLLERCAALRPSCDEVVE